MMRIGKRCGLMVTCTCSRTFLKLHKPANHESVVVPLKLSTVAMEMESLDQSHISDTS